jgi:hypothetical protein
MEGQHGMNPAASAPHKPKSYVTAKTRRGTSQLSGHYARANVQAFRVLAAQLDMDVQEALAVALNMFFEHHERPNRIAIKSGRRKKRDEEPTP